MANKGEAAATAMATARRIKEEQQQKCQGKQRRHGSTVLFVMVDYLFLFLFFCFLFYLLLKLWPGSLSIPFKLF